LRLDYRHPAGSKFSLYPVWLDLALLPLPLLFFFWHRKKLIISVSLLILALWAASSVINPACHRKR